MGRGGEQRLENENTREEMLGVSQVQLKFFFQETCLRFSHLSFFSGLNSTIRLPFLYHNELDLFTTHPTPNCCHYSLQILKLEFKVRKELG